MRQVTNPGLASSRAETRLLGGGCAGCWAAGYCAAFSPTSLQPPVACPLTLSDAEQRVRPRAAAQA